MFVFVPAKGADRKQNLFILLIIMNFLIFYLQSIVLPTISSVFPLCNLFAVKREERRLEVVKTQNAVTPIVWGDIVCQSLLPHIFDFLIVNCTSHLLLFFPFAAYHQLRYVGGKFIISLSNTHTDVSNIISCL